MADTNVTATDIATVNMDRSEQIEKDHLTDPTLNFLANLPKVETIDLDLPWIENVSLLPTKEGDTPQISFTQNEEDIGSEELVAAL